MKTSMKRPTKQMESWRQSKRGFTLIELLVAVTIGMGLTLAITVMLIRSEAGRRALTSINDTSNNGAYLAYTLDRTLRSAGSGFAQGWKNTYGCALQAQRSGLGTFLPRASAYPAPFDSVPATLRLAPLVVQAGTGAGGSDVLIVQAGSSGLGESPLQVLTNSADSSSLRIPTSLGLRGADLVALVQDPAAGGPSDCLLQQVATGFIGDSDKRLEMGGPYYNATVGGVPLADVGTTLRAWVAPLGNQAGNRPSFQLLGVASTNALVAYDLLRLDNINDVVPLADGVVDMRVRYGVDTDNNGVIDSWQSPSGTTWGAAALLNGSAAASVSLAQIISVRVALVMRNSAPERTPVTAAKLQLFSDLPAALRAEHTVSDTSLRYRVLDFTVPLRNAMLTQRP
jgi:type IV pilus assembly protein PilW